MSRRKTGVDWRNAFDIAETEGAPRVALLSLDESLTDKNNGPTYTKGNIYGMLVKQAPTGNQPQTPL